MQTKIENKDNEPFENAVYMDLKKVETCVRRQVNKQNDGNGHVLVLIPHYVHYSPLDITSRAPRSALCFAEALLFPEKN